MQRMHQQAQSIKGHVEAKTCHGTGRARFRDQCKYSVAHGPPAGPVTSISGSMC